MKSTQHKNDPLRKAWKAAKKSARALVKINEELEDVFDLRDEVEANPDNSPHQDSSALSRIDNNSIKEVAELMQKKVEAEEVARASLAKAIVLMDEYIDEMSFLRRYLARRDFKARVNYHIYGDNLTPWQRAWDRNPRIFI